MSSFFFEITIAGGEEWNLNTYCMKLMDGLPGSP